MALDSPLFLSKLECPVCGTINEFENIRVGAYSEESRMTDFCPSVIKWRNPKYQKYHPLTFFAATCSNCFYTREFSAKYKDWAKDNNFRRYRLKIIKEKHLASLAVDGSFIEILGTHNDHEKYPDETAIIKLLMAIYDELLNDHPSHLDLGRFYLRMAWMFRYASAGKQDSSGDDMVTPGHLEDIEKGITDLSNWMSGWGRNTDYLKSAVDAHFENSPDPENDRFKDVFNRLGNMQKEADTIITELEDLARTTRQTAGGVASVVGENEFYDFGGFDKFLAKILRMWEGVPRNEHEAMRFAVRYYINAFEAGKEISRGNQSIQAAYLIAELSRQIGDHDTARQYFNNTIKMGQDFINEIRGDRTRTAQAKKILEMAMCQGKKNLAEAK